MIFGVLGVNWETLIVPQTPILEILVRGTVTYLAVFLLFRVVLKRESGALGINDLLLVVLVADAAQNALADDYRSIPDGLVLVATIVFWSWFLNWLSFRFSPLERLVRPRRLPLIKEGRLLRKNMRRELITEDELRAQLRLQGVKDPEEVDEAYMEAEGRISVVDRGHQPTEPRRPRGS